MVEAQDVDGNPIEIGFYITTFPKENLKIDRDNILYGNNYVIEITRIIEDSKKGKKYYYTCINVKYGAPNLYRYASTLNKWGLKKMSKEEVDIIEAMCKFK